MSKRLIFSDLHLHPFLYGSTTTETGYNSRLWSQWLVIQEMIQDAVKCGVKHAYFGGDLFHVHGTISVEAMSIASAMFKSLRANGIKIRAIPGNHDLYDKAGKINALSFLADEEISGEWPDDDGLKVSALPYTSDVDVLKKFLGRVGDDGDEHLVLLHQGVLDVPLGSGWVINEILKPDMIPDNAMAFTGHYHQYSNVSPNLTVIGNLNPLDWNDCDRNKGWLIWDEETNLIERRLQTKAPRFMSWSQDRILGDSASLKGNFVRYTDPVTQDEQIEIRKALIDAGALSVEFPVVKIAGEVKTIQATEDDSVNKLVQQFDERESGRRAEVGLDIRKGEYNNV